MISCFNNPFVDYLNSLHNGNAANQNAIGEVQISSPYFSTTQVRRPLVGYLSDKLLNHQFIILTGHAGDGKTTLLAQLLEELGGKQDTLYPCADVDCGSVAVHYVKDFSELTKEQQDDELRRCFHCQSSCVLIANTGPLLGAFSRLNDQSNYESMLLDIMDLPSGGKVEIEGVGEAFLLNIARVDNTDFIKPYLQNLLDSTHWAECKLCPDIAKCPLYLNQALVSGGFSRASSFIENIYIWLQEYDHHATIRQITAHITYSLTGGLTCAAIHRHAAANWRYRYLFSNLFFGYEGARKRGSSQQIRGIQLVNEARFDTKPTCVDYDLYNKHEYTAYYPAELALLFDDAFNLHHDSDTAAMQLILKRAYLFFGQNKAEIDKQQAKETFSEWFELYSGMKTNGEKPKESLKKAICSAINTLFVGESLTDSADYIDLTLRRNNEQTSNVQLLSGRISTDNISLKCVPIETVSGQKQYQFEFCYGTMSHRITLPLLNYFYEIYRGIIITDIDPLLSNGIDSLKAQLLSSYSKATDENEVPLVYLSGNRWVKRKLIVNDHSIDHD